MGTETKWIAIAIAIAVVGVFLSMAIGSSVKSYSKAQVEIAKIQAGKCQ